MDAGDFDPTGPMWPLTAADAKQALTMAADVLFEPLLRRTLEEWSDLRRRCRLKVLKRQAIGRMAAKLEPAVDLDDVVRHLDTASPEEGYALLHALAALGNLDAPNVVLMAPYRDKADFEQRWCAVVTRRASDWAQGEASLFDVDDWLGLKG